ncbi:MBL fold metallo-hydrolase [bacterium]|nr:MBL fold metallo-hydrolase [candidate division CSSED10-310 bacterium]
MNKSTPIIQFLGATRTVTGSKTAVIAGPDLDDRLMIDCGLFQGPKELRLRNRASLPIRVDSIGSVLLTHGHLDHCGYLPRLVLDGFEGPVYCSEATAEIARIILMDSAHLQEEEAEYANKKGFSKHSPALPLYTSEDALRAIGHIRTVRLGTPITIGPRTQAVFHEAGHILGSTSIELGIDSMDKSRRILFSGDLGRYGAPILPDPAGGFTVDSVVMESTYGGRFHGDTDVFDALATIVLESMRRGGTLLIPAFAVGRTQLVLFALRQLKDQKLIPDIPIYIDSPMAIRVTSSHLHHDSALDQETRFMQQEGDSPLLPSNLHIHRSVEESKQLNDINDNAIIISASGMATGGRILHHLVNKLPHKEHTILFIGYQAFGTRGRSILEGSPTVKIHGNMVPVNAAVRSIDGFSAHADHDELLIWLKKFDRAPDRVFLNHGEDTSLEALREAVVQKIGVETTIAEYQQQYSL